MTVSSSTNRVSYSGNGSLTAFAYTFKVFDEDDLTVILRASDGTETVQTITTHYTVSGVGNAGGGNVTFGTAPASGVTVVILREQPLTQGLDLVPNDPFPAQSVEDTLDKIVFMTQKHEEELSRAIKASRTNVITGSEFTISASDRANKVFSFDASGDLSIAQELGTFKGDWATSTTYVARDIVKDTSTNNIFIVNADHTSSGAQPLTTNANSAKYDLLVDAASATTSATNAAASATAAQTAQTAAETAQTAAETAETNAETAETNAETAQTAAETAQTAAEAAQTAAETALDSFDDRYLGAKSSDPTVDNDGDALIDGALYFDTTNNVLKVYDLGGTAWRRTTPTTSEQTNINTVSGISANVTTVAGISSNVTTVAGISSDVTTVAADGTDIGTVAGISANVTTVAGISSDVTAVAADATDIGTVATNISNVNSVAGNATNINAVASNATNINTVAADATDIGTVAGISANVTTVSGISANVTTVAGISSDVTTVSGISANVTTVAGISANVTTVAGDTANIGTIATNLNGTDTIGTVAGSISNVNSVGGAISDVTTVASNLTDVQSFANTYRIGTTDPTTSLDTGDLFFNTTSGTLKVYTGSAWEAGVTAGSGFLPLTGGTLTGGITGTTATFSGDLTIDTNTLYVDSTNNRVGVGTASPSYKLDIVAPDNSITAKIANTTGANYIQVTNGTANGYFGTTGANTVSMLSIGTDPITFGVDGGTERMRIDSNGALLLGTTSRSVYYNSVDIYNASAVIKTNVSNEVADLVITNGNNNFGSAVEFARTNSAGNDVRFATISAQPTNTTAGTEAGVMRFYTKGTSDSNIVERFRVDDSGNLLVGTTSASTTTVGARLKPSGRGDFTANGGVASIMNRLTNDGDILGLQKDSTAIGLLGNSGNDFYVTGSVSNIAGVTFANSKMMPMKSGSLADASSDLGSSSYRWRDAYLSGSVYANALVHDGDTDTYLQFHGSDQWRVVTGGTQRLDVNNSRTRVEYLLGKAGIAENHDSLSGTSPTCNVNNAGAFDLTMTGNTTFTFSNPWTTNDSIGFVLELTGNGSTVTWPSSVEWAGGTAPDAPASGETDLLVFWTRNQGTTWYGALAIDAAA